MAMIRVLTGRRILGDYLDHLGLGGYCMKAFGCWLFRFTYVGSFMFVCIRWRLLLDLEASFVIERNCWIGYLHHGLHRHLRRQLRHLL